MITVREVINYERVHQAVFAEIRDCSRCPSFINSKMSFWKDFKAPENHRFQFSICRVCGYTVFLESFVKKMTNIDTSQDGIVERLNFLTYNTRVIATRFKTKEAIAKAISLDNIRYITSEEEDKIIRDYYEKIERDIKSKNELKRPVVDVDKRAIVVRCALNKAEIEAADRENNRKKPKKFECRFCGKKFVSKQRLLNHKCNNTDELTYVEKMNEYKK